MTECSFRFSRFDPSLRQADGRYPEDTWTELFELIDRFGDLAKAYAVYLPVEDAYVEAVLAVLQLHGASSVKLTDLERNTLVTRLLVEKRCDAPVADLLPQTLPVSDVPPIVRAGLRGQLWCQIRSTGVDVTFGQDLYMYVRSRRSCEGAKARLRALGLFVQDADYPVE